MEELWFWIITCFGISMFFAVATFLVYTVTPELKNLQGSIFRSCLVAYISWLLCTIVAVSMVVIAERFFILSETLSMTSLGFALAALYFGAVYILWLNVMSFDIWKKFREVRSRCDNNIIRKREKVKFIRYSIFAWGGSLVPIFIFALGWFLSFVGNHDGPRGYAYRVFILGLPILGSSLCNICFYISTAFRIRKVKAEMSRFTDGENKHEKENEQWFNLYVRLFVVMDGPLVFYIPVLYFWNSTVFKIISVLEGLQGVLIFFIFVWKDDVKRSFWKQCVETMGRLRSFSRCSSTLCPEE